MYNNGLFKGTKNQERFARILDENIKRIFSTLYNSEINTLRTNKVIKRSITINPNKKNTRQS